MEHHAPSSFVRPFHVTMHLHTNEGKWLILLFVVALNTSLAFCFVESWKKRGKIQCKTTRTRTFNLGRMLGEANDAEDLAAAAGEILLYSEGQRKNERTSCSLLYLVLCYPDE